MKDTPLTALHLRLGTKMADAEGWNMPQQFSGPPEEHRAVRSAAGLFDVSHLGRIEISGAGAGGMLQALFSRNIDQLTDGTAAYGVLCNEAGGILDAVLLARLPAGKSSVRFLMTTSAPATAKVLTWLAGHAGSDVTVRDRTAELCQLALQGPLADAVLEEMPDARFKRIRRRHLRELTIAGSPVLVSRTGFTGETGYELFVPADRAPALWESLLTDGSGYGLLPCGAICRDILRIEAGFLRYGIDIDETRSPAEAGLMKVVDLSKEFVGKAAIVRRRTEGAKEQFVGYELYDKGVPRPGGTIFSENREIGAVTSANHSYSRRKDVGFGYVLTRYALPGQEIEVEVKDREITAKVIDMPFYRRK
jgi:aminomethyltransferase